jgi:hypothetical protein
MGYSEAQLHTVVVTERVSSALSLMGTVFIMGTFLSSRHFRKPINRLIFYASIGNVFMSIATLISRQGIERGPDSPMCQFQAFLIQMYALSILRGEKKRAEGGKKKIGSCSQTSCGFSQWPSMCTWSFFATIMLAIYSD